jgi:hypothetical protein
MESFPIMTDIQFNPNLLPEDAPDPGLRARHEGVPVLSHPVTIATEKAQEAAEDAQGRKAYQEVSDLFSMLDEVSYGD